MIRSIIAFLLLYAVHVVAVLQMRANAAGPWNVASAASLLGLVALVAYRIATSDEVTRRFALIAGGIAFAVTAALAYLGPLLGFAAPIWAAGIGVWLVAYAGLRWWAR